MAHSREEETENGETNRRHPAQVSKNNRKCPPPPVCHTSSRAPEYLSLMDVHCLPGPVSGLFKIVTPLILTSAKGVDFAILTPNLGKLRQGKVKRFFPEWHSW